jgi:negative regulator of sigma E activity
MNEYFSAWIDGELDNETAAALYQQTKLDPAKQQDWGLCHLIGDAMRDHESVSADFMTKFNQQLAAEPILIAPQAAAALNHVVLEKRQSRWKTYTASAMASCAAVAVVGWLVISGAGSTNHAVLANKSVPVLSVAQKEGQARLVEYINLNQHSSGGMGTMDGVVQANFISPTAEESSLPEKTTSVPATSAHLATGEQP